jgi:hypothetical protein
MCPQILHIYAYLREKQSRTGSAVVVFYGVFGRFDLVALCGCHTLNVLFVLFVMSIVANRLAVRYALSVSL